MSRAAPDGRPETARAEIPGHKQMGQALVDRLAHLRFRFGRAGSVCHCSLATMGR